MTSPRKVQTRDDVVIEFTLRRSRRRKKTVSIVVAGGEVTVSAPMRTPNAEIEAIVRERGDWIKEKLESVADSPPNLGLVSGDKLPYLGNDLELVVEEGDVRRPSAHKGQGALVATVPRGFQESEQREAVRAAIVAWYRVQAGELLTESVARWLPVMGRSEMPRVLVREQKTRWGSCSADGTLRFSWRLAMVAQELIDSVAVHELAHLEVMNHSPAFWEVVLRAMPDARERRKRLSEAGRFLPL